MSCLSEELLEHLGGRKYGDFSGPKNGVSDDQTVQMDAVIQLRLKQVICHFFLY